jgi:outer membrane immunogenic protein
MKKIVLATVLAGLTSTAALAADLGARAPYAKAPAMMQAVSNWSGFYIGGNVGYGWGNDRTDFAFFPSEATFGTRNGSLDTKANGVIGGAQIGYNWQVGSIVTGIEADIQGSGIRGSATGPLLSPTTGLPFVGQSRSSDEKLSWFGTVRGRLGTSITPMFLLYATGGLAYGEVKNSANTFFAAVDQFPASVRTTKVGWTAGAGGEWMFAPGWSTKLEYLFVDLGGTAARAFIPFVTTAGVQYNWKNQDHIVRAGVNYHF